MVWDISGKMSKNLISKHQSYYLIIAFASLVITIPIFYLATLYFYTQDIDEILLVRKSNFIANHLDDLNEMDIITINKYSSNSRIIKNSKLNKDSIYTTYIYNKYEQESEPYRVLESPIQIKGRNFIYSTKTNLLESEDLFVTIILLFSSILLLLLVGMYLIQKRVSTRLWQPFYNTLDKIEKYELNKSKNPDFTTTDITEFNFLNDSITKLIEKNKQIYDNQSEFLENATHELQTPIAIFKVQLDMLIQSPDISDNMAEKLSKVNDTISRLSRINKNLLLLSKIEKENIDNEEQISLKQLIIRQIDIFKEIQYKKTETINLNLEKDIIIIGNKALFEILINNLIMNSIRHSDESATIKIEITGNKLIVSNTGISRSLSKNIFERFSKDETKNEGTGLGLSIIKKIVQLYNFKIEYIYKNDLHTFILDFNEIGKELNILDLK
ncbi:MAG: sensor histidine kinase [Ignavibacteriae bacterium HGW-Ignavibacteriae-4]|jgi:signal transduction histidine kinase|nr:MAG: sensor histidine kinase [Ignavibacteriae bacterium HGW-Ignavibacteriae-4]